MPGVDLKTLGRSFMLALKAENKSPKTLTAYGGGIDLLDAWLKANGRPTDVTAITRADVAGFISSLLERGNKPATASHRYRALKTFFRWAVEDGEIEFSPMAHLKAPRIPETPPGIFTEEQLKNLFKECEGTDFASRRDMALVRLLIDSGMRRAEIAGLSVADVDIVTGTARVLGKGGRLRDVPFGNKAAQALDRYLRSRTGHPYASEKAFWLGERGPLTHWGIGEIVRDRAIAAGVGSVGLHKFRHTWAHLCQMNGMSESALMANAGWRARAMVDRYAKSAAGERARDAHKQFGPGDRL